MARKIGIRPWVDFAFRKIFGKFGNEICLISLLNSILDLPYSIRTVQFQNPFSLKDFRDDKLVCVDVKATDDSGRTFVVEIQIVVHESFAKRALFYACTAYTDQLREGQGYGELKATYSVCLLMRKLWDDQQLHHHYRLVERTTGRVMEESVEIHTVELSKYNGSSKTVRNASELEQWCYWFNNADGHSEDELQELLPGLAFLRATSELQKIHEITEEKNMYDSREKALLDYQSSLIDARNEARAQGLEEGRQEGRQEGWKEGLEEGRKEGQEEGVAIGLEKGQAIGQIRLLQDLLSIPVSSESSLGEQPIEQLTTTVRELQAKLRQRQA